MANIKFEPEKGLDYCPVCFNEYSNNKTTLPCGHVLCVSCYGKMSAKRCPMCMAELKNFDPILGMEVLILGEEPQVPRAISPVRQDEDLIQGIINDYYDDSDMIMVYQKKNVSTQWKVL